MNTAPAYQDLQMANFAVGQPNETNKMITFVPITYNGKNAVVNLRASTLWDLSDYDGSKKYKTSYSLDKQQTQVFNAIGARLTDLMTKEHMPVLLKRMKSETVVHTMGHPLIDVREDGTSTLRANVFIKEEIREDGTVSQIAPYARFTDARTKTPILDPFEALRRGTDGILSIVIRDVYISSSKWGFRMFLNEFLIIQPGSTAPSSRIDMTTGKFGNDIPELLEKECATMSQTTISNSELQVYLALVRHAGPQMLKQVCTELHVPDVEPKIAGRVPEWQVPSATPSICGGGSSAVPEGAGVSVPIMVMDDGGFVSD